MEKFGANPKPIRRDSGSCIRQQDYLKGGNPVFHYSYDLNQLAPATAFGDPRLAQVRLLPGPGWERHASLPAIRGRAGFSDRITLG